jgi:hypothetical protein
MKWITRKNVGIDRVACSWLIKKYIDKDAVFEFIEFGEEIDEDDFKFINQKMQQYLYEESFAGVMYFEFDFQMSILKVISGGINLFLADKLNKCSLIPVFSGFLG